MESDQEIVQMEDVPNTDEKSMEVKNNLTNNGNEDENNITVEGTKDENNLKSEENEDENETNENGHVMKEDQLVTEQENYPETNVTTNELNENVDEGDNEKDVYKPNGHNNDAMVTVEHVEEGSKETNHEDDKIEIVAQDADIEKITDKQDSESTRNESCGNRVLHCLSQVPCASLIAWIILLVGLGGLTGGLLIGIQRTRDLIESDNLLWFLEYVVAGVVAGMFVFGTLLLCIGHISTDPTSRHIFHTTKRNLCAQGLNITMLIFSYIFGVIWVLLTAIFGIPLYLIINILIIQNDVDKINLVNYGLHDKEFAGDELDTFVLGVNRLLVIYITVFVSSILITISMIHFLIVISANLTHLKDTRLATLNAYSDHTEMQNSKHSVVDTTM